MNKLRTIILTQEDYFFIPKIIKKVYKESSLIGIVNIKHKSSLENKKIEFLRWFGFFQVFKLAMKIFIRRFMSLIDNILKFKLYRGECSVRDVAKYLNISYIETNNINDIKIINILKEMGIDLIISLSAPQKFKKELIKLPKYGAINVHGAYLPDYRGCFPSFWQLYNGEQYAGSTVHLIDEEIDTGKIICQEKVYIGDTKKIFEVIRRTKKLGGELLIKSINEIQEGKVTLKENNPGFGRYYSWPSKTDAKIFRKKGLSLI